MLAKRTVIHGSFGAALVLVAGLAAARPIRIEFNDAFPTGDADWSTAQADGVDFDATPVASGAVPFDLLVGTTAYNVYCANEDGVIWFTTTGADCGTDPSGAIFTVLGADWETLRSSDAPSPGVMSISLGLVDREADIDSDGNAVYSAADAVQTLRFMWNEVHLAGDPDTRYFLEALFYDVGGGNFDVEFLYGEPNVDSAYDFGTQSIEEGGVTLFQGTAPFTPSIDYLFHFVDGVLTRDGGEPPPVDVPEPAIWSLLVAALALIPLGRRRRLRAAAHVV